MPQESEITQLNQEIGYDLIFLTDLETAQVRFVNTVVESFCGLATELLQVENSALLQEIIHPDDYEAFKQDLESFRAPGGNKESFLDIRLKDRDSHWRVFRFRSRIYAPSPSSEHRYVLSLAQWIPQEDDQEIPPSLKGSGVNSLSTIEEYEQLLEVMDEAFCLLEMIPDLEGQTHDFLIRATNPAYEAQIGLKNVLGKTLKEVTPKVREKWLQTFAGVADGARPVRFETYSRDLNTWLDVYAFKIGCAENKRMALLFRNITDKKALEQERKETIRSLEQKAKKDQKKLRENAQLLETVFDTTNLAITVLKTIRDDQGGIKDFRFLRVNKVLRDLYLDQDVVGKTYLETSKYGVEMGMFDALKKVMTTGEPMDKEFYFNKDNYDNWFRMTARKQKDLLVATLEDITQRKVEAEQLKENIRFKQQLVRTSPETIMIVNLNTFSIRYINRDLFPEGGITREKVEGMNLVEIMPYIHPRDRENILNLHKTLLKSPDDAITDIEVRVKLDGTSWEWFSVRGKIFRRRDAHWVDEYVLLVRNIHEQKNIQRALYKAEKLSIQGEVARSFAHELRNPLASISMVRKVLDTAMDSEQKETFKNYLDILARSTESMNNLVSSLLNASNYSPAVLEKQDLAKIMDKTLDRAADRIYLVGMKVIRNYTGPHYILADTEKLIVALLNIVINASEATTPEEGILQVEIKKKGTDVVLSITDNGLGMEEGEINRLFDAFYTKKEAGLGVGLNSVKNILEEHDAQVKVESKPGQGTTFRLFFHDPEEA